MASEDTASTLPLALVRVARAAMEMIRDGMHIGLGTGRAAEAFIRTLGEAARQGLRARCVTTSTRSEKLAAELGIGLGTLDDIERLDLAFDGADEVSPSLDLVKGLGGALLRERVVAHAADRFIVMVTEDKLVSSLGTRAPIPVEVVRFAHVPVVRELERAGTRPVLRRQPDGTAYVTDNGNYIVDVHITPTPDPRALDARIRAIPGVIDTGLFLGMAHLVLIGRADGSVERRTKSC